MITEWNAVVAGSVLCLIFSWFLGVVGRSQDVQFGKIGPIVGIVGTLILTGLAVVGPPHVTKFEGVSLMRKPVVVKTDLHTVEGSLSNLKRRSLVIRTMRKIGPRPDKDHLPYEYSDGKLSWVTKSEYVKLKRGE